MKKRRTSLTPHELRDSSDEDESLQSSICQRQINSSTQLFNMSLKSWSDPVQPHDWTNLPKCITFIAKNGCDLECSNIGFRRTLDNLSPTVTMEQLNHILNGYADLYELVLHFVHITADAPVEDKHIHVFGGTSSDIEQQKHNRNVAFIMYNPETSLFAPLYATHCDGHPQTCFAADDKRIFEHIETLFATLNQEVAQSLASQTICNDHNNDATKNTEESQTTDSVDELLPSQSNEAILRTSKIIEDHGPHDCQTVIQPDLHVNRRDTLTDLNQMLVNDFVVSSSIDSTQEAIRQHPSNLQELLDKAKCSRQDVGDTFSIEIDDCLVLNAEISEEQQLVLENSMINSTSNQVQRAKKPVNSSRIGDTHARVDLSGSTTEPSVIVTQKDRIKNASTESEYNPPNVIKQPRPHRRVRMLKDLSKHRSPLVQAGDETTQKIYPEIGVPGDDGKELYIRVKAVTENKYDHPLRTVAPEKAEVDWTLMKDNNERICLRCDPDIFDPELECVYLLITPEERKSRQKKIKVHLFNWKQCAPAIKEVIERENLRLCRLEFYLCKRIAPGVYECVSPPAYSSVIEELDGDVSIDETQIEPKQLCELGNEKIIIPLSVRCPKKGFRIECNGNELPEKEIGMEPKKLSFISPPKVNGTNELHLIIKRTEYVKNSSERIENLLYEDHFPYVPHDNGKCVHIYSQAVRKTAKKKSS